jgi:hypothetical protein
MGAVSMAVTGYHVIAPPGADFPGAGDFLEVRHGVWIALAGSVLMIAGGIAGAAVRRVPTGTWTAGPSEATPAPEPATPVDGQGTEGWISPAPAEAQADPASSAPSLSPALSAAPAGSTAPPGFAA